MHITRRYMHGCGVAAIYIILLLVFRWNTLTKSSNSPLTGRHRYADDSRDGAIFSEKLVTPLRFYMPDDPDVFGGVDEDEVEQESEREQEKATLAESGKMARNSVFKRRRKSKRRQLRVVSVTHPPPKLFGTLGNIFSSFLHP